VSWQNKAITAVKIAGIPAQNMKTAALTRMLALNATAALTPTMLK